MKKICMVIFVLISLFVFNRNNVSTSSAEAIPQNIACKYNAEVESSIICLKNDVKEIRRDQLNYKIEKDLMKEMYLQGVQIINIVIAIVLALFGFLGFFGLRDISVIQKATKKELENITKLKGNLEVEIKSISEEQNRFKESYAEIMKINEAQNVKIKLLELRDKARSLYKEKNYLNAIEYCTLGLELEKNNISLMIIKSYSLFKLRNYVDAIRSFNSILDIENGNYTATSNLCELYLITKNKIQFDEIYNKIKLELFEKHGKVLNVYFEAFRLYIDENENILKEFVRNFVLSCDAGKNKLTQWDLSDISIFLKTQPDTTGKEIINNLALFIGGEKSKEELLLIFENKISK